MSTWRATNEPTPANEGDLKKPLYPHACLICIKPTQCIKRLKTYRSKCGLACHRDAVSCRSGEGDGPSDCRVRVPQILSSMVFDTVVIDDNEAPLDPLSNACPQASSSSSSSSSCFPPRAKALAAVVPPVASDWVEVRGNDIETQQVRDTSARRQAIMTRCSTASPFVDTEFPAEPKSIDGQKAPEAASAAAPKPPPKAMCQCRLPAQVSEVQKAGPTKGRPYLHCATRKCKFFRWADGGHFASTLKMWWQRFQPPAWAVVREDGFQAADLLQVPRGTRVRWGVERGTITG